MIVVSDTGPMGYLIEIGGIDLLRRVCGTVLIPPAVMRELSRPEAPQKVRDWMSRRPEWVLVRSPVLSIDVPPHLGPGETEALALAQELEILFLSDDLDARRFAQSKKMEISGTLGVLIRSHIDGHIDIRPTLTLLANTSFHSSPALIERAIQVAERQRMP